MRLTFDLANIRGSGRRLRLHLTIFLRFNDDYARSLKVPLLLEYLMRVCMLLYLDNSFFDSLEIANIIPLK